MSDAYYVVDLPILIPEACHIKDVTIKMFLNWLIYQENPRWDGQYLDWLAHVELTINYTEGGNQPIR